MIKAVIFDMDGVLIDTEPLHYRCWKEILKEHYDVEFDYDIYLPCIGSTRQFFRDLVKEHYGVDFPDLDEMNRIMKVKKSQIVKAEGFPEMPGVENALKQLKEMGYKLAVASSSPESEIMDALTRLGLMPYFDSITSGDHVEHPKPEPDTFLLAAERLNVPTDNCLVIEDSTNGGRAALAAKMDCVWLHNPHSGHQDIPNAILEIPAWTEDGIEKLVKLIQEM